MLQQVTSKSNEVSPKTKHGDIMIHSLSLMIPMLLFLSTRGFAQSAEQSAVSKIEIDNERVIVRRNIHAPHSITPMHSHRAGVVVYLSDVHERTVAPDGSSREVFHNAGDVIWAPARTHRLENLADKPIEAIEIELKPPEGRGMGDPSEGDICFLPRD
jgi:hypothetical protein